MRVAIVTESFLPTINGVTNSVCRVLEHLAACGHQALVVAPAPAPNDYAGHPVTTVPAVPLPGYRAVRIGLPARLAATLTAFEPDVVHLASPTVLGGAAAGVAQRIEVPAVAVFQTDLAGFARRYGFRRTDAIIWAWLRRIHARAGRTLVPSTATLRELERRRFPRLALWRRGVDLNRFHPRHRCPAIRRRLAPAGEILVGYVGRLAPEKRVRLLSHLDDLPGVRLVLAGQGPEEPRLRRLIPRAAFLGLLTGPELSRVLASLDVFVHTGADETFCQAVQEALASGVPVVAPAAGGPLDLVAPGRTGLLYPADDTAALREAVAALVADPARRAWMGRAARASVLLRTWTAVGDELLGHYRDVLGPERARRAA